MTSKLSAQKAVIICLAIRMYNNIGLALWNIVISKKTVILRFNDCDITHTRSGTIHAAQFYFSAGKRYKIKSKWAQIHL